MASWITFHSANYYLCVDRNYAKGRSLGAHIPFILLESLSFGTNWTFGWWVHIFHVVLLYMLDGKLNSLPQVAKFAYFMVKFDSLMMRLARVLVEKDLVSSFRRSCKLVWRKLYLSPSCFTQGHTNNEAETKIHVAIADMWSYIWVAFFFLSQLSSVAVCLCFFHDTLSGTFIIHCTSLV